MGFEPTLSGLTGRHVNRYTTAPHAETWYHNQIVFARYKFDHETPGRIAKIKFTMMKQARDKCYRSAESGGYIPVRVMK